MAHLTNFFFEFFYEIFSHRRFFLHRNYNMADGLKTRALSALTRSSKRGHSEVDQSPSKSTSSLSERLNGQGPCPDKDAPGPDKNASIAKRRRSLTAEVEGIAPLSSFQKEFMDHRNEIRNMLDNYMASLAAQFRDTVIFV